MRISVKFWIWKSTPINAYLGISYNVLYMKILYLKTKFHDFRLNLVAFEIENAACIAYIAKWNWWQAYFCNVRW